VFYCLTSLADSLAASLRLCFSRSPLASSRVNHPRTVSPQTDMHHDPDQYRSEVERRMPKERTQRQATRGLHPRIFWQQWSSASGPAEIETSSDINRLLAAMESSTMFPHAQAVCIIRDVTRDWQSRISRHMKLDHAFFKGHLRTSHDSATFHPWHSSILTDQPSLEQRNEEDYQWRCIDAVYSPSNTHLTRMSYYRISNNLCECKFAPSSSSY
jgi:hypothetical protein